MYLTSAPPVVVVPLRPGPDSTSYAMTKNPSTHLLNPAMSSSVRVAGRRRVRRHGELVVLDRWCGVFEVNLATPDGRGRLGPRLPVALEVKVHPVEVLPSRSSRGAAAPRSCRRSDRGVSVSTTTGEVGRRSSTTRSPAACAAAHEFGKFLALVAVPAGSRHLDGAVGVHTDTEIGDGREILDGEPGRLGKRPVRRTRTPRGATSAGRARPGAGRGSVSDVAGASSGPASCTRRSARRCGHPLVRRRRRVALVDAMVTPAARLPLRMASPPTPTAILRRGRRPTRRRAPTRPSRPRSTLGTPPYGK